MTRPLTRAVVAVLVVLLVAGCLSGGPAEPSPSPTTQTTGGTEWAGEQPDPNKSVELENRWNRSVDVQVRVVRNATGETVHEGTYELEAGEDRTVYDLSEAEPDGIETFAVVVTARNATEQVEIKTSKCYGNAYAEIQPDGSLYLYYAIC